MKKIILFALFSAIVISSIHAQEIPDEVEEDSFDDESSMPLTRHERDLAVAESVGGGGKGGGAAGGKVSHFIHLFK